ncbi:MAG: aminotransferase class IV [Sediminibacterium sp. Gen4]|jgi:aminodeoxychorismate lyase|uniref:aminotransferase class IV n=1 Tax=unclassified Sediminibacterium TaxID=2635961 RepID=UPI0015BE5B91|nr:MULTISPECIES: aminotransferase class IV [unclassified Sediminibacterium]MBW0159907.1 aminotransferase class IV [Sediminibacterium sp.]MBW0164308.1 aminotransferase class IV [Sediminibacterium sp.]NWK66545.1 aminotransferase class IV [Sediminibacterium sp. Gen4]
MREGDFLFYDGQILRSDKLLISPNNRSYRYGDGCFETIKVLNGKIMLADYHFERLFSSLETLRFKKLGYHSAGWLEKQILSVVEKNGHAKRARVRVTVTRGDGGIYDEQNHYPYFLIQSWSLQTATQELNENGLVIDIYKDARKTADLFSSIKSNNYLPYVMGALWAKENHLNDAILLNPDNRVADATIANVFIVKDGSIKTPALTEGPVNGVMRRHLLHLIRKENIPVEEGMITVDELLEASELFLTNAIHGIKWVKQLGNSHYTNATAIRLYKMMQSDLKSNNEF